VSATVCIRAGNSWGAGCLVDGSRRLILTSHHLVGDAATALVSFPLYRDGRLLTSTYDYDRSFDRLGKIVDADPEHDLAVIQLLSVPKGALPLKLAEKSLAAKEPLGALGNPGTRGKLWIEARTTVREMAPRRWRWHAGRGLFDHRAELLQMDSPLDALSVGGPLVNAKGELAGLLSWSQSWNEHGEPAAAMSYGINLPDIRSFLEQVPRILEPKGAADHELRGEHNLRRQLYEIAIDDFTTALHFDSKLVGAHRRRALAYFEKGDLNAALADLDQALKLDANDAASHVLRGRVYERKAAFDEALAEFDRAVQLNAKDETAYYHRGWTHERKGDRTRALEDYDRALALDPADSQALIHRGDLHRAEHQNGQAVRDYQEALRNHPDPQAFCRLAEIGFEQGRRDEAVRICTIEIERFDPEDPAAFVLRGRVLAAQNQGEAAIADFGRALALDPRLVAVYRLRAAAYEQKGDAAHARADADRAKQLEKRLERPDRALSRRYLKIVNDADEPIRIHLQYETLTVMGTWHWYPAPPGTDRFLEWTISPKQTTYLFDDDFKVKARKLRIWAEGISSGRRWTQDRDRDVILCPKEYVGKTEEDYTFHIGK
jgi:tetratricopeptide (TPR) repeat protein